MRAGTMRHECSLLARLRALPAADMRRVVSFTFYPEGYEWVEPAPTVLSEGYSGGWVGGWGAHVSHGLFATRERWWPAGNCGRGLRTRAPRPGLPGPARAVPTWRHPRVAAPSQAAAVGGSSCPTASAWPVPGPLRPWRCLCSAASSGAPGCWGPRWEGRACWAWRPWAVATLGGLWSGTCMLCYGLMLSCAAWCCCALLPAAQPPALPRLCRRSWTRALWWLWACP